LTEPFSLGLSPFTHHKRHEEGDLIQGDCLLFLDEFAMVAQIVLAFLEEVITLLCSADFQSASRQGCLRYNRFKFG
jgi:hypothetical protein